MLSSHRVGASPARSVQSWTGLAWVHGSSPPEVLDLQEPLVLVYTRAVCNSKRWPKFFIY